MINDQTKCDFCNGKGIVYVKEFSEYCNKCKGTGELNWIQLIFGVRDYVDLTNKKKNENYNKFVDSYYKKEEYLCTEKNFE